MLTRYGKYKIMKRIGNRRTKEKMKKIEQGKKENKQRNQIRNKMLKINYKINTINQNEKAVTLISLVITIIILLILAGVTLSLTLGDNGIITQAQKAKEAQEIAAIKEDIQLAIQIKN